MTGKKASGSWKHPRKFYRVHDMGFSSMFGPGPSFYLRNLRENMPALSYGPEHSLDPFTRILHTSCLKGQSISISLLNPNSEILQYPGLGSNLNSKEEEADEEEKKKEKGGRTVELMVGLWGSIS
uniref:Bm11807 n=1 Tax=Brugia malayi TaxID=6279 RepID=A0A1I9GAA3_BRUMA|nr:Bm11807 [Brugia malayi]